MMINPPKTIEEARKHRYGPTSPIDREGRPYREGYCAEDVWTGGRAANHAQCARKAVVDGLWCKQHDPKAKAARAAASEARWKRHLRVVSRPSEWRKALERIAKMTDAEKMREVARMALDGGE